MEYTFILFLMMRGSGQRREEEEASAEGRATEGKKGLNVTMRALT